MFQNLKFIKLKTSSHKNALQSPPKPHLLQTILFFDDFFFSSSSLNLRLRDVVSGIKLSECLESKKRFFSYYLTVGSLRKLLNK